MTSDIKLQPLHRQIYIVDFFNIFSDFREIKYKKNNIDFHCVKHCNKNKDTQDFFELFFTRYISYVNINKSSHFIFIMKKLNDNDHLLRDIVYKYRNFKITFMILEEKYTNNLLDKNKDDFLCQYIFYTMQKKHNVILISNDKYRDRQAYISLFNFDISIQTIQWSHTTNQIEKSSSKFKLDQNILNPMITQKYTRCSIPKNKLMYIL